MNKKDYIAISDAIREEKGIFSLTIRIAEYMEKENPLFNKEKFLAACGFPIAESEQHG